MNISFYRKGLEQFVEKEKKTVKLHDYRISENTALTVVL